MHTINIGLPNARGILSILPLCTLVFLFGCTAERQELEVAQLFSLAESAFDSGKYEQAVSLYDQILVIKPGLDTVQWNRDVALQRLNPQAWLVTHPNDDDVRSVVWSGLLDSGDYSNALYHAEKMADPSKRASYIETTYRYAKRAGNRERAKE
jgi:tetratricopeptide (TPR) repeat protein